MFKNTELSKEKQYEIHALLNSNGPRRHGKYQVKYCSTILNCFKNPDEADHVFFSLSLTGPFWYMNVKNILSLVLSVSSSSPSFRWSGI